MVCVALDEKIATWWMDVKALIKASLYTNHMPDLS